ncbi:MAG: GT-D fold domain-containing protein [Bacteroidales bacterium]|nr:GT-D fold domain-containing protein [Bacteroidales bacterium]
MDSFETIEAIKAGKSLARFGDGELGIICNGRNIGFQSADNQLGMELKRVLQSDDENCMIGLPGLFDGLKKPRKLESRLFWAYTLVRNWKKWNKLIKRDKVYADTQATRFYINYTDTAFSEKIVEKWKEVWNDRHILIVEGEKTKLGIGNDLFNNVRSLERILCPAHNAFAAYDDILKAIKTRHKPEEGFLILLALGPTATVLAYDLAQVGYHAVDIGHIDIEYMWMRMGVKIKAAVKGKEVNEYHGTQTDCEKTDLSYLQQIVDTVSISENKA